MGRPRKAIPKPLCIPPETIGESKDTTPTIPSKTTITAESKETIERKTLDRTRSYGTVCGSKDRTCYVQDNIPFDSNGVEIVEKD